MKKILVLLLSVFMLIPFIAKADMGAPGKLPFKVVVTNKNGAKLYQYDWDEDDNEIETVVETLPYNSQILVVEDEDYDGVAYIESKEAYIKLSDITLLVKDYKVTNSELGDKFSSIIVKDVVIRKGPAEVYDSTGTTIKAGEKVTLRLIDADSKGEITWAYVEYNGVKGFIDTYGGTATYREIGTVKTISDIKLSSDVTIPVNTIITSNVYALDPWSRGYKYIIYNGIEKLISSDCLIYEGHTYQFTTLNDVVVYEQIPDVYNPKKLKKVGTIKKGTIFTSDFYDWVYDDFFAYYEKGNVKGWIYIKDKYVEDEDDDDDEDYEDEEDDEEEESKIRIINEELEYCKLESDGSCVDPWGEDDDDDDYYDDDDYDNDDDDDDDDNDEDDEDSDDNTGENNIVDEHFTITKRYKKYNMYTIYYCIGGAIIISLTSIVTIILINKKKKEKNTETKESIEETTPDNTKVDEKKKKITLKNKKS